MVYTMCVFADIAEVETLLQAKAPASRYDFCGQKARKTHSCWGHLSDIFHFNKTQGLNGKGNFPMTFLGNFASNYNLEFYVLPHYL